MARRELDSLFNVAMILLCWIVVNCFLSVFVVFWLFVLAVDYSTNKVEYTNHNSIAYFLGNISAKNYQNQLMCDEVISVQHQCRFSETQRNGM